MVSDRAVQTAPQDRAPNRQPPPEVYIGNQGPGGSISPDRTRLAELATFEQKRRQESARLATPPDPNLLAVKHLQGAGFTEADLSTAPPYLRAAPRNTIFQTQLPQHP